LVYLYIGALGVEWLCGDQEVLDSDPGQDSGFRQHLSLSN